MADEITKYIALLAFILALIYIGDSASIEDHLKNTSYSTITVSNLSGIGTGLPVVVNTNGTLQVNRTAGAGITLKSPDGNNWCVTVINGGTIGTTSGTCP